MNNLEWISKGNTGCTFATLFAKNPAMAGWVFIPFWKFYPDEFTNSDLIISIEFPERWSAERVKQWALGKGFYVENTSDKTEGLRIKCDEGVSWVQYFGKDSHVSTRKSPQPMLMYTRKLNKSHYVKVGFNGLLHLAHAWYDKITDRVYDMLWERSYEQTRKKLGQSPDITQAAKTTWVK